MGCCALLLVLAALESGFFTTSTTWEAQSLPNINFFKHHDKSQDDQAVGQGPALRWHSLYHGVPQTGHGLYLGTKIPCILNRKSGICIK